MTFLVTLLFKLVRKGSLLANILQTNKKIKDIQYFIIRKIVKYFNWKISHNIILYYII